MKLNNGVILGLFAGAAIGAIAGLLLAPEKGSKTLENLSRKGKETFDKLGSKFSDIAGNVSEKLFGDSDLSRKNEGAEHLDRTRSTASQFNSR